MGGDERHRVLEDADNDLLIETLRKGAGVGKVRGERVAKWIRWKLAERGVKLPPDLDGARSRPKGQLRQTTTKEATKEATKETTKEATKKPPTKEKAKKEATKKPPTKEQPKGVKITKIDDDALRKDEDSVHETLRARGKAKWSEELSHPKYKIRASRLRRMLRDKTVDDYTKAVLLRSMDNTALVKMVEDDTAGGAYSPTQQGKWVLHELRRRNAKMPPHLAKRLANTTGTELRVTTADKARHEEVWGLKKTPVKAKQQGPTDEELRQVEDSNLMTALGKIGERSVLRWTNDDAERKLQGIRVSRLLAGRKLTRAQKATLLRMTGKVVLRHAYDHATGGGKNLRKAQGGWILHELTKKHAEEGLELPANLKAVQGKQVASDKGLVVRRDERLAESGLSTGVKPAFREGKTGWKPLEKGPDVLADWKKKIGAEGTAHNRLGRQLTNKEQKELARALEVSHGISINMAGTPSHRTSRALIDLLRMPHAAIQAASRDAMGRKLQIFIGDKVLPDQDQNQDMKGEQPRGWPPGSTWDMVGGAYTPWKHQFTLNTRKGRSGARGSTMLHELGHAVGEAMRSGQTGAGAYGSRTADAPVDMSLEWLAAHNREWRGAKPRSEEVGSWDDEMAAARKTYRKNKKRNPRKPRIRPYFLQDGTAGLSEAWAELWNEYWSRGGGAAGRRHVESTYGELTLGYLTKVLEGMEVEE
jgi:hypothetical protein